MRFEIHPAARASINSAAADALALVEKIAVARQDNSNDKWWLPKDTLVINDSNIVDDPVMWLPHMSGGMAFVFLFEQKECFGLTDINYKKVEEMCSRLLKIKWVQNCVSEAYIVDRFVDWVRERYARHNENEFLDNFVLACERDVTEQTVLAPVQHLVIERAFDFGRTKIVPLNDAFFSDLQTQLLVQSPDQSDDIARFSDHLRSKLRGCSAVEVKILAESKYAKVAALQICEDSVGLLRFFCQASFGSTMMSPVTLLEALNIPKTHILLNKPGERFSYTHGTKLRTVDYWRISKRDADEMAKEGLAAVGCLIDADDLNDFGKAVRSSILAFTRAITFSDLADRLVFAFSAIEGLMLRNQSEPIQQNVGERVAFFDLRETVRTAGHR